MRLKRLELFGFKSFADRMVLDFEHEVTGIVGPNGCGKSNVVDAVRWVLGEQRAKSMRGGEMTDVIFKGSASRPAMSVAEVTMVLDNSDETIEERGEEVAITRRVYRTGEGEYLIDGDKVRLKDVREMLFGTGLGSRGYSVLEQGRIDAVLSANALERRAIFEEAAGISRYRQRKKEAESRLKRVEADCQRLDDVLGELERRERSLRVQAGKARAYVEARDAWRVDGLRLARHQAHVLTLDLAAIGAELGGLEQEVEEHRGLRAQAEADVAEREREQESLAGEVGRVADEVSELVAELRALDERRSQLAARVKAWRAASVEERGRADALGEKLAVREAERRELEAVREGLESEAAEARSGADALAQRARVLREEHKRLRTESEAKNKAVLDLLHRRTSERNRVGSLEERRTPLAERLQRAEGLQHEAAQNAGGAEAHVAEAAAELERLEAALAELEAERQRVATARGELVEAVRAGDGERQELELEVARLGSRVEALLDWEREREGLERGAQAVLAGTGDVTFPELTGRLAGLVADHLRVDTRLARALDAVLGDRAQALVVASPADARAIVGWLKEGERGRVRLALPGACAEVPPPALPASVYGRWGVEGALLERTRVEPGAEPLARALLADVVVVESLALALELGAAHPRYRFVTPAGDVVEAGCVSGGHVDVQQGAVGRRAFAAELERRRAEVASALGRAESAVEERRRELAEADARVEALRREAEAKGQARARAKGVVESAQRRLSDLRRALEVAASECAKIARERDSVEAELTAARERVGSVEARFEEENAALQRVELQRREHEAAVETVAREEATARVGATSLEERLTATRRRCADLAAAIDEARAEAERAARLSEQHAASADEGDAEGERLTAQHGEMLEQRGQLEERLAELREREREGRQAIDALRKRGDAVTAALEALLDGVSQGRLKQQKLELESDELGRRALEDFELEREQLVAGYEPDEELARPEVLTALVTTVRDLKRKLDKIGHVNLDAVEELEEVTERLSFLQGQRGDLEDARRQLLATIAHLDQESEKRFVETFEEVRDYFRTIFRQLFGGGKAELSLQEDVPVLEAGIEIVARPPGRESLPITLLSGGQRTLTALALLFAVFRSRPSPFCVLDEVDAALDDANIGRFLSLVQHAAAETQYVIVTHNKGTMAACRMLYGVTMQVKGVSRVVGVELSEVDEFVPEATGRTQGRNGDGNGHGAGADDAAERTVVLEPQPRRGAGDDDGSEADVEASAEVGAER